MPTGIVKYFNADKKLGYVTQDRGQDVFRHHTAIESESFRTLPEGLRVAFDVTMGRKVIKAHNVRSIAKPSKQKPPATAGLATASRMRAFGNVPSQRKSGSCISHSSGFDVACSIT